MKKQQKGFSLVELMVVIAIIAILAAVAIPMYSNYTTRAKIGTALTSIGGTKSQIAENIVNGTADRSTNVDEPTKDNANGDNEYSTSVDSSTGQITLSFGAADSNLNGRTVLLTPSQSSGAITWLCTTPTGNTGVSASMLPSPCTVS